jgi:hypothetical protein
MAAAGDYQGCIPADHKQKTAHPDGKGPPQTGGLGRQEIARAVGDVRLPAATPEIPIRGRVIRRSAMQQRARFSVHHFGLLACAIIVAPACQDGPFSDEEMDQLRKFALTGDPPADTSNSYENDLKAAKLGKLLYFDGR